MVIDPLTAGYSLGFVFTAASCLFTGPECYVVIDPLTVGYSLGFVFTAASCLFTEGLYTKGTRAHTHRELIREWL